MISILEKTKKANAIPLSSIVYAPESYKFSENLHVQYPEAKSKMSKGHAYDITTNIFDTLPFVFEFKQPNNLNDFYKIYGRHKNNRVEYWIKRDLVEEHENLDYFKLLLSKSIGTGKFGETLSDPIIAKPYEGHTQTFLSFGRFNTEIEAMNLNLYLKTKFLRALLSTLKITQDNKRNVWANIPLQNFTSTSDIDWTQSIANLDQQLYKKYDLSQEEIDFIETNVKEME